MCAQTAPSLRPRDSRILTNVRTYSSRDRERLAQSALAVRRSEAGTHPLLQLQRTAGNRAVTLVVVQRKSATDTAPAKVPGFLALDPVVANYVGKEGGGALKVETHSGPDLKALYLAYAKKHDVDTRSQETFVNGFTDLDTNVIHLNRDKGDAGTIVHEALHLHSDRQWISDQHWKVNEGATEFFTRRVCDAAKVDRSDDAYPEVLGALRLLVTFSSVEALAAAYFKNETKQLQSDLEAVRPGLWTDWRITIIKSIKAANALLESLK